MFYFRLLVQFVDSHIDHHMVGNITPWT